MHDGRAAMLWPLTLLGKVLGLVLLVVGLAVVGGGIFWASDGNVDANVVDKTCQPPGPNTVTVKTKLFGIEQTKPVGSTECYAIQVGFFVEYHVRSGRTIVYAGEGGRCVWDSATSVC